MVEDVDDDGVLFFRRSAKEVIRKHRAVDEIPEEVEDLIDFKFRANLSVISKARPDSTPAFAALVSICKVCRRLTIMEEGSFLDQKFDLFWMLLKEHQIRTNRCRNTDERC